MPPKKREKAGSKVTPKAVTSWHERLVAHRQERKDYLFHLRERDFNSGAPTTLAEKVHRVVELAGGKGQLKESPPSHLSFKDCMHKRPMSRLDWTGLEINGWFPTLVARTVPPGVPVKPSTCTHLSLNHTDINDVEIKHIAKLKFIQVLDISGCDVLTDGSLHLIRRSLSQLTELHINDCRNFTPDTIMATWVDCTRLRSLYAQGCLGVTDRVLQCIATTKRNTPEAYAHALDFRRCRHVTDSGVSDIANTKLGGMTTSLSSSLTREAEMTLRFFGIGQCLHVKAMAFFAFETSRSLAHLETLEMATLDVDETSFSWLATGCPRLTRLNLANCVKLNDFCLLLLAKCRALRWLNLKGCALVTPVGMTHVLPQPFGQETLGLRNLLVDGARNDDDDAGASPLAYLNLKNCIRVDDTGLAVLAQTCLDLETLNLRGVPHVTDAGCRNPVFYGRPDVGDDGLRALSKLCRQLVTLDLAGAPRVTSDGVAAITATCRHLMDVNLSETKIDDHALVALAALCPAIHTLHLTKCKELTDVGVDAIAGGLFALTTLVLAYCGQLTNRSLEALGQAKLPLRLVDLTANERITDDGLTALCKGCQTLRTIRLKGCERLTDTCIRRCVAHWLPFAVPPPHASGDVCGIESASPQWIDIYEHLVGHYEAACRLQASVRKWKKRESTIQAMARRKLQRSRRAAVKIQRCYRRHHQWQAFLHMLSVGRNLHVVVKIQATYRGNKTRVGTRAWKALAFVSANSIQRGAKHHLYRRHGHARTIQRIYRGHCGRVDAHALVQARRDAAGLAIVQWYRRALARYDFVQRARAIARQVRLIQQTYRSYSRRRRFRDLALRFLGCATRIQS
ncbi:hypothetical protein As57867_001887, partial [Aphanomyces stellatus]